MEIEYSVFAFSKLFEVGEKDRTETHHKPQAIRLATYQDTHTARPGCTARGRTQVRVYSQR